MQKIIDFFKMVYQNYMQYVAIGVVALAFIVVLLIIIIRVQAGKIKNKKFNRKKVMFIYRKIW